MKNFTGIIVIYALRYSLQDFFFEDFITLYTCCMHIVMTLFVKKEDLKSSR